jgi:cobalt-zinc-cadmium resistance protein CzcA
MLLYSLFNSMRMSLLAISAIPFAMCGGILALYVTGLHFSISAAVGFISLFGVSVMDSIMLVSFYNELRARHYEREEALKEAAEARMRQILTTSLSACIGLFPAAMSTAIGSQVQAPLATVVVGGMLVSPILSLLFLPVIGTLLLKK